MTTPPFIKRLLKPKDIPHPRTSIKVQTNPPIINVLNVNNMLNIFNVKKLMEIWGWIGQEAVKS